MTIILIIVFREAPTSFLQYFTFQAYGKIKTVDPLIQENFHLEFNSRSRRNN